MEERRAYLSGRCVSGEQRGSGTLIHASFGTWFEDFSLTASARCGATPGKRSALGFVSTDAPVTCKRCLQRIAAVQRRIDKKIASLISERTALALAAARGER